MKLLENYDLVLQRPLGSAACLAKNSITTIFPSWGSYGENGPGGELLATAVAARDSSLEKENLEVPRSAPAMLKSMMSSVSPNSLGSSGYPSTAIDSKAALSKEEELGTTSGGKSLSSTARASSPMPKGLRGGSQTASSWPPPPGIHSKGALPSAQLPQFRASGPTTSSPLTSAEEREESASPNLLRRSLSNCSSGGEELTVSSALSAPDSLVTAPEDRSEVLALWEGGDEVGDASGSDICSCGNIFMPDAEFCRKCGSKRPEGRASKNHRRASSEEEENIFVLLPSLRECHPKERPELFRRKLKACSVVFDFRTDANRLAKQSKKETLLELVEYANSSKKCFAKGVMQDVVDMVAANLFRELPGEVGNIDSVVDNVEWEQQLDPAWPHIQIVYEFFVRFIVSTQVDPKAAKDAVNEAFLSKFLGLLTTEDPRERDYLKMILHRIYGKFVSMRGFVRRSIQHWLHSAIYEAEAHDGTGISELLEILGSIVDGFAVPLKAEHKDYLRKTLIPLHRLKSLASFHEQLANCMAQYVEKEPSLAYDIVKFLLNSWPQSITHKQILFLDEIEELLESMPASCFDRALQLRLFKRIALCITSVHFQVSERALALCNIQGAVNAAITQNHGELFPIIIGALYSNSRHHWNGAVHTATFGLLKTLMEASPDLFEEYSHKYRMDREEKLRVEELRLSKWERLEKFYEKRSTSGNISES